MRQHAGAAQSDSGLPGACMLAACFAGSKGKASHNPCNVCLHGTPQRILRGTSYGIGCFTVNRQQGLLALAEKVCCASTFSSMQTNAIRLPSDRNAHLLSPCGRAQGPNPAVRIYTVADLKCVATVSPPTQLGYTALAFSADGKRLAVCTDEPDLILTVHEWRQVSNKQGPPAAAGPERHCRSRSLGHRHIPVRLQSAHPCLLCAAACVTQSQVVVQATLPKPVHSISFHPLNADQLCSTGSGQLHLWTIEKLWDKCDMVSKLVDLESVEPTCHAYFPGVRRSTHSWLARAGQGQV